MSSKSRPKLLLFFPLTLTQSPTGVLLDLVFAQMYTEGHDWQAKGSCRWNRRITICKERRCQGLSFCLWIKWVGYKGQDKCRWMYTHTQMDAYEYKTRTYKNKRWTQTMNRVQEWEEIRRYRCLSGCVEDSVWATACVWVGQHGWQ